MNIDYLNDANQRASRMHDLSILIQREDRAIKMQLLINGDVPTDLVELRRGYKEELEDLKILEKRHREYIKGQIKRLDKGEDIIHPANTDTSKPVQNEIQETERTKLQFRNQKGDKIALYHVLRKLSEKSILPKNDWQHIAQFLIDNVTGFETNDLNHLAGELSRTYNEPKDKNRIDLPTDNI